MKNLNKESYKLVAFAAMMLAVVLYAGQLLSGMNWLLGVFGPIILGGAMAFVFNVPMKRMENLFDKWKVPKGSQRGLAILSVILFFVLIVTGVLSIVIPTLTTAVGSLQVTISKFIPQFSAWLESTGFFKASQLNDLTKQLNQSGMINKGIQLLGGITGNVTSIFGNFFTVLMSIFLMLAMLGSKEQLASITDRLLSILLPKRTVDYVRYAGNVAVDTYNNFLMGQLIEAFIIGVLVFAGYSLAGMPYAPMIAVLSGVLSFIPYIGPFTACGLGAIFIFTVDPLKALLSIVVFQVIQLIEGNVIYPRVVGSSIGLPGLFTMAAALVGGNLFGLVGMIFFTPIFAVIYRLVREWVEQREAEASSKNS